MRLRNLPKLTEPGAKRAHEIEAGMTVEGRLVTWVYQDYNRDEVFLYSLGHLIGDFHWDHVFHGVVS